MIDEIDKMTGGGPSGDPTAAMLEVLDPSQNNSFVDHYLNLPFDLSSCLFICTANNLFDIPAPLRDRMEVIRIAGYTVEEKVEIAWRYMMPRLLEEHGITDKDLQFTDEVLSFISSRYSREAGLRNFERNLAAIMRKRAHEEGRRRRGRVDHRQRHGSRSCSVPPRYPFEEAETEPEIGAVTGFAWTATGGDLMVIEALAHAGHGTPDRHWPVGGRDARVGRRRALLRALARRRAGHRRQGVQGVRPAHPLSGRRRSPRTARARAWPSRWPSPASCRAAPCGATWP